MPSRLQFNGALTIAFQVADMAVAQAWYRDVLGLTPLFEVKEMGWCELATETQGVSVGLSQVEAPKVGAGPVPTFGVKDIDAARGLLEGQGVRFDGETQVIPELVKLAGFFDPDGNVLMLSQDLGGNC